MGLCQGQNQRKKEKEDNLLLLFAFFFLLAFGFLATPEAETKNIEKVNSVLQREKDVFLSYDDVILTEQEQCFFREDETVSVMSSPCFVDVQVLGMQTNNNREDIISYQVEKGDAIKSIAEKFDISVDTIKWANDIKNNTVKEGDELLILPVTGVFYYVEKGDTVSGIAKMHKAKTEEIISFNKLEDKSIIPGDRLIIPNGTMPVITSSSTVYSSVSKTSFINPVPGGVVTQGLHSYNAVDIYNVCGSKIVASASGKVTQTGWGSWPAGNFVKIDHGSVIVLYAHLQNIYVKKGDYVVKGQQIGTVGNTGKTIGRTGCHLHFDFLSRKITNPFARYKVGARL